MTKARAFRGRGIEMDVTEAAAPSKQGDVGRPACTSLKIGVGVSPVPAETFLSAVFVPVEQPDLLARAIVGLLADGRRRDWRPDGEGAGPRVLPGRGGREKRARVIERSGAGEAG